MLERPVLAACGMVFTWDDVRQCMIANGTWARATRRAARGRALVAEGAEGPGAGALRKRAEHFRRRRRLMAREDLAAWLAHWELTDEEWVDWLDRSLLVETYAADTAADAAEGEADPAAPARAPGPGPETADGRDTWVEVVCSGDLDEAAWRMARALGAWATSTNGAAVPEADQGTHLDRAYEGVVAKAFAEPDLERELATHAAEWTTVLLERAELGTLDAAKEAVACCSQDGALLADVAALANADHLEEKVRIGALEGPLRTVAASAPLGAPVIVGTEEAPGLVVAVRERRLPDVRDADDRELARLTCVEGRIQAAMDRWVSWRG